MHYNFEELYKTQTMLDEDFLRNEAGFDLEELSPDEKKTIFKNYYLTMCLAVHNLHFKRYLRGCIEELLDTDEKKYYFLMAQARQLKGDKDNGSAAIRKDDDGNFMLYDDVKELLNVLGFVNNGTLFY